MSTTINKAHLIAAIKHILETELRTPGLENFSEHSRLNQDLYLDSILVLQLLVSLEGQLGIEIPDDALNADDFHSVASLADFLLAQHAASSATASASEANDDAATAPLAANTGEQEPEEFLDIKVHCFVSCLCEIIKADPTVDHRPFYFGVWDAEVIVDENFQLNYHSASINHDFFRDWYKKIYGVTVHPWYKPEISKGENIQILANLLAGKSHQRQVMVMLDMYRLPERENKFNQNPFPHYVLLEETADPETWMMYDPDFRWEGPQRKSQVLFAIESPAVGGGYYFDSNAIRPSAKEDIYQYFLACFKPDCNPMTDSVRTIVQHFITSSRGGNGAYVGLSEAIKQLPVLAIRKYAYEHGFAYFWRELELQDAEFEQWCEVIEVLVSSYKKIHYRALKLNQANLPQAQSRELLAEILQLLDEQNEREFTIKRGLFSTFTQWRKKNHLPDPADQPLAAPPLDSARSTYRGEVGA